MALFQLSSMRFSRWFTPFLLTFALLMTTMQAQAAVSISDAWIRASTPGQSVGAAYMRIQSSEDVSMVYAETERAGSVEMHSMTMHNGVMKMRHLESLTIPAGQAVSLAPGGLHLMLFELTAPFKAGEQVKFRLCFKNKQGAISEQFVTVPVKSAP